MLHKKKADSAMPLIFGVIIVLVIFGWFFIYAQRECHNDDDCPSDHYCGSDFSCHKFPDKVVSKDYVLPAFIIALGMILAAMIIRWERFKVYIKKWVTHVKKRKKAKKVHSLDHTEDKDVIHRH